MREENGHITPFLNIRWDGWICLLLTITTLFAYYPVRNYKFIDYDDDLYVTDNLHVQNGLKIDGIVWAFTSTHTANWHPLTWLSHMLDRQLYGMNPGGHHRTSLIFHIVNTLLLFLVFKQMSGKLWQSGFIAALFALHPLHVESVAQVAQRKDVLSTFFWILTMLTYVRYVKLPTSNRYVLALLCFILGLMAKPMLVTLPFVLLLLDCWPLHRIQFNQSDVLTGNSRKGSMLFFLIKEKIPFFVVSAASSIITLLAQQSGGAIRSLETYPVSVRFANALASYVGYMGKMIWPSKLTFFYPHPGIYPVWKIAGSYLILISISFMAIKKIKRCPWMFTGWFWYVGTLVPVIGLVQVGAQAMADRYTYVPLIGIFIIIAWGGAELSRKWRYQKPVLALIAVGFVLFYLGQTRRQLAYWADSATLFKRVIAISPENYLPYNNLGMVLEREDKNIEAMKHYLTALEKHPHFPEAHNNLGNVLMKQDKTEEAIHHYSEALRIRPGFSQAHNNLGNALLAQGKRAEAIRQYLKALSIDSNYEEAHYNLGIVLFKMGKLSGAINQYLEALRINPVYAEAHNNLGVALAGQGKIAEAVAHFKRALRLKPDLDDALLNIKKISASQKKDDTFGELK